MSDDEITRAWLRAHNLTGIVILHRSDDSQPVQSAQIEGYQGEIRDAMQRHQQFGLSTMPLPGSKGIALYQSGHRGAATVITLEDPRYRPVNQKPGEVALYMVDGTKGDGAGGTMRLLLKGALGRVATLFGVTIMIGDSHTQTVTISGANSIKLAGNVEITGDLKVDGQTTVQNINIAGAETGGGAG
jgi:phage baseplate assembly protein V